jgi:hypothetical protein
VLGLVEIDIYTGGSRNRPPVEMHFPLAVFFFFAASGSFPAFFKYSKQKLNYIYIYTHKQIYVHVSSSINAYYATTLSLKLA